MSQLAVAHRQSKTKKPLTDTTVKVNIPRPFYTSLARKDSVSLRPGARSSIGLFDSRYQKGDYIRLRCSPHSANILRAEPYIVDENGRSLLLRSAENIKPRSRKSRYSRYSRSSRSQCKSVAMASPRTPVTPVNQQGPINGRQSITPASGDDHGSGMTPDVPPPPPKDTPRPVRIFLLSQHHSLLDASLSFYWRVSHLMISHQHLLTFELANIAIFAEENIST